MKLFKTANFENMFSVLAASAFLPFLPMKSIHLVLLNLIYDISCIAISWDLGIMLIRNLFQSHANGMPRALVNLCFR